MNEEQDFLAQAEQVRGEQVAAQQDQVDPAVQAAVDHAQQTAGSAPPPGSGQPGFMGLGGLSAGEIEAQKADIAQQRYAAPAGGQAAPPAASQGLGVEQQAFLAEAEQAGSRSLGAAAGGDPTVQSAVDHATETAASAPEPGSQQPGFTGLGGLSADDIQAQEQDIAEQSFAARDSAHAPSAEGGGLADPKGLMDEVQETGNPQDFLAEAEQVRQEQVAGQKPSGDPAIQAAVDHAQQTAGTGPEPGSEQPGFMGLGGLSAGEVEAQKQEIARERYRGA
jgi:hypothetical protein